MMGFLKKKWRLNAAFSQKTARGVPKGAAFAALLAPKPGP
jgi:hypothetical protein